MWPADEARAVAGMGGGVDAGLGTTGTRRRATMPADVLESQARDDLGPARDASARWG